VRTAATKPDPQPSTASGRGRETRARVREERRALYRRLVSEAAERVFAEKGSEASRMQEIAREAGVSLATIYTVVDGKDALVADIHERRMREFLECICSARDSRNDTLEAHLAVLLDGADFFMQRPQFLQLCCRDGYGWASGAADTDQQASLWAEGIAVPIELFRRGIDEGIYVDEPPELLARKMLALKQVELTHWVEQELRPDPSQIRARLRAQFLRAFCRPEAAGREALEEETP